MRRSFKYRLCPNKTQGATLARVLETCRLLYNRALAERKAAYEEGGRSVRWTDQNKAYAAERNAQLRARGAGEDVPAWYADVSAVSMRDVVKRLDVAFGNFFRRVKGGGGAPGYPRFRRHGEDWSIPFDNYNSGCSLRGPGGELVTGDMGHDAELRGHRLRVFGVGDVKVRLHRPVAGKIKTVAVKREAGHWYVVFSCVLPDVEVPASTLPAVGIDLGIEFFLTTSDGEHVENPKFLRSRMTAKRRLDRSLARKERGGSNYRKAKARRARFEAKVSRVRKEFHRRVALSLVRRYGLVAVEGLSINRMVRGRGFGFAICDAGWGQFVEVLKQKAEEHGAVVVVVEAAYTSQTCSRCGEEVKKELRDRRHDCTNCGLSVHRDTNAARVILGRALGQARAGPAAVNGGRGHGPADVRHEEALVTETEGHRDTQAKAKVRSKLRDRLSQKTSVA